MFELLNESIPLNVFLFIAAAMVIVVTGSRLTALADYLADRLGWGEAITGTVFLGLSTALPGLAASITAALEGHPALAISNAIGGIAVQTTFLAIADITHTKANLEHAAASLVNMIQTAILLALLTVVLLGLSGPEITVLHVHPASILLLFTAVAGFTLAIKSHQSPMWRPRITSVTIEDVPDSKHLDGKISSILAAFAGISLLSSIMGITIAHSCGVIVERGGISEAVAGALFSGIATSLPELVATIAAVRRKALTLAVSDIVGGNFFDILFVFAADIVYLKGSLYHATGVGTSEIFITAIAIALNIVLLLGMLYRQRTGPANIGFESLIMLLIYTSGFLILSLGI